MTKRRGNSEGSIYFRQDRGLWAAAVTIGYDEKGKRRRRTVYGKTKREVQEKLARLQSDALNGALAEPKRITLATFLTRWLEDTKRPAIEPTTFLLYSGAVKNHITPRIGGVQVSKLTPIAVQALYADLERDGVGARMRQVVHNVLRAALDQAVEWGLAQRNPCDAVQKPKVQKRAMKFLTQEQVQHLLKAAEGDRLEALYVLAVMTGLREGELLGLRWEDVDLKAGVISLQSNLQDVNGRVRLKETKTSSGRRRVDLPELAVNALREHRKRMLAEGHPGPWVFCTSDGEPLRKRNLLRWYFKPLLRKAGLPEIRFYDLRHTHATLLLQAGVHPKVVQERLGHARIAITLDTYSHVLPSMQKEAAAKLDNLFAGGGQ